MTGLPDRRRLRVRTPSRLHFGLLGWGPGARRQFGGLGLMIESPALELSVEASASWGVVGPVASRVERLLPILRQHMVEAGIRTPSVQIRIHDAPPEHVGLGAGTQISLAVASALLHLAGIPEPPLELLAQLTGRGDRSGIGLHGFRRGGLIVDGGRKPGSRFPPLMAHLRFPEDWWILIVQHPRLSGLSGSEERRAFAELPPIADRVTERLCRLVLLGILPAVVERELPAFGAALAEMQSHVGALFAPAQGGPYTAPRAAAIIEELRRSGFVGIGQSSWGPTLYAFSDRPRDEVLARADGLRRWAAGDGLSLRVTRADNQGAVLRLDC